MARNTVARIEIPLDIADVDVVSTRFTRDGKLLIRVESRIEATRCGCCGQEIRCNYGHGQEVRLRHLSVFERETYICLRPKRGQCQNCLYEPTTTQQLSWYEQRSPHTLVYDRYLMKQLVNSTIEDVIPFAGSRTVNRIATIAVTAPGIHGLWTGIWYQPQRRCWL